MERVGRAFGRKLILIGLLSLAVAAWTDRLPGQFMVGMSTQFELSDSIHLDEADALAKSHLERVKAFVAVAQWDEAVETLRQVMESQGDKVIALSPRRYINVRDYCHLQLSLLPAEALALYRGQVDPPARRWYEQAVASGSAEHLRQLVDQYYCSSWGDQALDRLAEMALEQGDYGAARGYWESLVRPAVSRGEAGPVWLGYPDTELPQAETLARLVLVSILEGSYERAAVELASFRRIFSETEGRLGGRQVNLAETLAALVEESRLWPLVAPSADWTTFGGAAERTKTQRRLPDVAGVAWRYGLPPTPASDYGYPAPRVGESRDALLSYHPVLYGGAVLVSSNSEVYAFDLHTGRPAWGNEVMIFLDMEGQQEIRRRGGNNLGVPRFTLTVANDKLYARLGNPVTSSPNEALLNRRRASLVCLDLKAEGRVVWGPVYPEESWAFEGTPLCAGDNLYVAMRRGDVRPQAHVACFNAETGELRWRRLICAAETPGQGQVEEISHNLLTQHGDTIYYNTNLGAVAALSAQDGRIRWITLYPRAKSGDLNRRATHFYRDLTPCVYEAGRLFVAPSDSPLVLALDAPTGLLLWETQFADDAVHLLGVGGGNLIASGEKLRWINAATGKIVNLWPDGPTPKGFGRGALVEDKVVFPERTALHVFSQQTGEKLRTIELTTRDPRGGQVTAGNLLVADDALVVTTNDSILVLNEGTGRAVTTDEASAARQQAEGSGGAAAVAARPAGDGESP